jgi:hypothetical protein
LQGRMNIVGEVANKHVWHAFIMISVARRVNR